jgi:hypothetical protein
MSILYNLYNDGLPRTAHLREQGSETGITKGRSITRDAVISAGFANPSWTARDVRRREVTWQWATGGQWLTA